jgi:hypothetical protein
MYNISVSTVNAITSQIPETDVSASVQTITTGFINANDSLHDVSTAAAPSGNTLGAGLLVVAIVLPVGMALIGIFVIALLLFIW